MDRASPWQLLYIDDEAENCRQIKEFLEGEGITAPDDHPLVVTDTEFESALHHLENQRFDVVILDLRLGPLNEEVREQEAGHRTLEAIRQRRFVPVVFYTGLPHLVRDRETALVRVVERTEGALRLLGVIREIFRSGLPTVNRALLGHLERVQRDYMWDFVAHHWDQFTRVDDRTDLAYLLARRLAMSLSGSGINQLAQDLGHTTPVVGGRNVVHPMRYYVIPPVEIMPLSGDLYQGDIAGQKGYWVLLTPSCDLVQGKADFVLLAQCVPLTEQREYQKWSAQFPNPSQTSSDELEKLLKNNRKGQSERYYYLPGALTLPDLVVDFQKLVTLPRGGLDNLERLASMDSPFAEALSARVFRYYGRIGTPDLDQAVLLTKLQSLLEAGARGE